MDGYIYNYATPSNAVIRVSHLPHQPQMQTAASTSIPSGPTAR
jgi:hypothetical protein